MNATTKKQVHLWFDADSGNDPAWVVSIDDGVCSDTVLGGVFDEDEDASGVHAPHFARRWSRSHIAFR